MFAKWLINNRGVDFDTYVELYSNNLAVKQEIDRQTDIVEYAKLEKEVKEDEQKRNAKENCWHK